MLPLCIEVPLTATFFPPQVAHEHFKPVTSCVNRPVLVQTRRFSTFDERTLYEFFLCRVLVAETQTGLFLDWKTKLCLRGPLHRITVSRLKGANLENARAWRMEMELICGERLGKGKSWQPDVYFKTLPLILGWIHHYLKICFSAGLMQQLLLMCAANTRIFKNVLFLCQIWPWLKHVSVTVVWKTIKTTSTETQ